MTTPNPLQVAKEAARATGTLLRSHFGKPPAVATFYAHDIKLELDVQAQDLITKHLLGAFPDHALYGEEGLAGNQESLWEWIVDPIDGTVNFFYGIPHFCVSIALRHEGVLQLGVIYDPMCDELWEVERGGIPLLNGQPIRVSTRTQLSDAILAVGFAKSSSTIKAGLPLLAHYVQRARKCRLMGSAALDVAYVACGRLDGYVESSISLWDIAAGQLLVEQAGGTFVLTPHPNTPDKFSAIASSGLIPLSFDPAE